MNVLELFKPITTLVFDMDGVLTNGTLLVLPNGLMARSMNIKDGYGLQLAVKKGYRVVVISGGKSPEVQDRLLKLGVLQVFMQVSDKVGVFEEYMQQHQIEYSEVLYMGDDIPDMPLLQKVALPCCPKDAVQEVRSAATYISHLNGGHGCGRDVIEKVMKIRGDWNDDTYIRAQ